jgi:hypothetical protein
VGWCVLPSKIRLNIPVFYYIVTDFMMNDSLFYSVVDCFLPHRIKQMNAVSVIVSLPPMKIKVFSDVTPYGTTDTFKHL